MKVEIDTPKIFRIVLELGDLEQLGRGAAISTRQVGVVFEVVLQMQDMSHTTERREECS